MTTDLQACIDNCLDCYRACQETVNYCVGQGGEHVAADHLRRLQNCADVCQTSATLMLRESPLHAEMCGLCAEICDECAADCGSNFPDDSQMKTCADVCRSCADSCRRMSGGSRRRKVA